jgi:hypothetical protein
MNNNTTTEWKQRVLCLLKQGSEIDQIPQVTSTEMAQSAIDLFIYAAAADCNFLLDQTIIWANSDISTLSLAALVANAPEEFLQGEIVKSTIVEVLMLKDPDQILEFVTLLRSKVLGRGLGSRPQKLVRRIMENWSTKTVLEHYKQFPKSLYSLVRLVHPRYTDERGEIIIELLHNRP